MNEPPGVPSALGIEAVEWIAEGGGNVTVRVTGRWRRRRPAWSGQPTLVVEAPGRHYRFPALPEPPSLTGIGPGMWRISFTVPAALAPELGGRAWLQFGSVSVPLPSAVEFPNAAWEEGGQSPTPPPVAAVDGPRPSTEVESEDARRRAEETGSARRRAEESEAALDELAKLVSHLEGELTQARGRVQKLTAELTEAQGHRRAAQQREHAERALRLDLARQLTARTDEADRAREALGELAAAEDRVRTLEADLTHARRRIDEAEQAAAAAIAARDKARREADRPATPPVPQPLAAPVTPPAPQPLAAPVTPPAAAPAPPPAAGRPSREQARLALERSLLSRPPHPSKPPSGPPAPEPGADPLVAALRRELEVRAAGESAMRSRLVAAETRLAARDELTRRTEAALAELRRELDGLREALTREREAREVAERQAEWLADELTGQRRRSREAQEAIGELRGSLDTLRLAEPPEAPADPVQPERLNEALARLREQIAPQVQTGAPTEPAAEPPAAEPPAAEPPAAEPRAAEPPTPAAQHPVRSAPPGPGRRWLAEPFAVITRSEPDRAGRLLVSLLPAQAAVWTEPIAYDLVLGPELAVRVSSRDGRTTVQRAEAPRDSGQVRFRAVGDHAALARMVMAGGLRRRFAPRVARLRGIRSGVSALEALRDLRLDLGTLHRLGVRLEPQTAIMLVAAMIPPAKTAGARFVLAYAAVGEGPYYLVVRDGAALQLTTKPPADPVAVTITGPAGALEAVVSGETSEAVVTGDRSPLDRVRAWVHHAQCG